MPYRHAPRLAGRLHFTFVQPLKAKCVARVKVYCIQKIYDQRWIFLKLSLMVTASQPLYTRYPIVARRAWPSGCIQDALSSRSALGRPAAFVQPLGRVRRASKGILHTKSANGQHF